MTEPDFEGALRFAQELIRIPSLSGAEEEVADRLQQEMASLGFSQVRRDALGNVIGVIEGGGSAPPVLLNSHLDVVAEGDHAEWEYPPFSGEVADGFLHGRGAMDIKGPLALQTYAAAALKDRSPGDVIVAHTVFEERGGWGMEHLIRSGEVDPAAVIIGESTQGDIAIGHRGRGEIEISIEGLAGHASAPERARNALDLVPAVLSAVKTLTENLSSDPVLGASTVAPTMVDVLPESRNVIPDRVAVTLDWRILPGDTQDSLVRRVEAALDESLPEASEGFRIAVETAHEEQRSYTGIVQERMLFTPGFLMGENDSVVRAATDAVGRRDGEGPAAARPWTFATDGGWTQGIFGIPTIGFAPGEERYAHTNRERLDVEEARWALSRYPGLILAVMNAVRG